MPSGEKKHQRSKLNVRNINGTALRRGKTTQPEKESKKRSGGCCRKRLSAPGRKERGYFSGKGSGVRPVGLLLFHDARGLKRWRPDDKEHRGVREVKGKRRFRLRDSPQGTETGAGGARL